jgi:hypothetical protein
VIFLGSSDWYIFLGSSTLFSLGLLPSREDFYILFDLERASLEDYLDRKTGGLISGSLLNSLL